MKLNYKNTQNEFETKGEVTFITILKKNGDSLKAKIDSSDLEKVKSYGTWFAEWNKDYNSYLVENISATEKNKKGKPLKHNIQTVVLDVQATTPIIHINGDTLDNRKVNLTVYDRHAKNEIEKIDNDTVAILLRDKYGNVHNKALISASDVNKVITDEYTWTVHKENGENIVIANTPEGRIHLDRVIMEPDETKTIHHINLNPLDNRRENLEITHI